jgi:CPA2 family monovalent cation:H+ antiporter-2
MSMLLTPVLFIVYDKLIVPRYAKAQTAEADEIDEQAPVILAGVGRFGGVINHILRAAGYNTVVLDHHSEHLDRLRVFGIKVFFGDASRPDLLRAAGIDQARMLIIAIDDRQQAIEMVSHVTAHYPHVHIVARAVDRHHVYELWAAGCRDIIRENFDGAVRAARSALEALGLHPYDAELQTRGYVESDKRRMVELAELYDPDVPVHENAPYVARAKESLATLDAALKGSSAIFGGRHERGWLPPSTDDVATAISEHAGQSSGDA